MMNESNALRETQNADRCGTQHSPDGIWRRYATVFAFVAVGVFGLGMLGHRLLGHRLVWDKLLTQAVMPCAVVWELLIIVGAYAWWLRSRRIAISLWLLSGCYALTGNVWFGTWLTHTLEAHYVDLRPLDEPRFDALIVLGGGTMSGFHGNAQLAPSSGDRVMLAARMYHRGNVARFLCTGEGVTGLSRSEAIGPAEESRELLMDLGVPSDLIQLVRGRNTWEEMQWLRQEGLRQEGIRKEGPAADRSLRIGLLTSAWHLPRALRLAERAGLKVEPVPADFASIPYPPSLVYLFPSPEGFSLVHRAVREHLAMWVGR